MIIEETVHIEAELKQIWKLFIDLTGWSVWNTVARDAGSASGRIEEGEDFTFSIRPFAVPVALELAIEDVVPCELVVWSGKKFGIFSRHEWLFQKAQNGVLVTSREKFQGLPLLLGSLSFPEDTIRKLTVGMLNDLKRAAERAS